MECKCETCVRKDCADRTKQDDLRIVINCSDYLKRQMTNADRIRAMTDEELAEVFCYSGLCSFIQAKDAPFCEERGACDNCLVEWLQQPAEEE